jgi:hypothetical protein
MSLGVPICFILKNDVYIGHIIMFPLLGDLWPLVVW